MPKPVSIKTCFSSCDHVSHCLLHTSSLLPLFPLLFTHRHSLSPAELILGVPGFPLPLAWAILPSIRLSGHPEKLPNLLCQQTFWSQIVPLVGIWPRIPSLCLKMVLTIQYFYYPGKYFPFSSVTGQTSLSRRMNCTWHTTMHRSSYGSQRSNSLVINPVILNSVSHNRRTYRGAASWQTTGRPC